MEEMRQQRERRRERFAAEGLPEGVEHGSFVAFHQIRCRCPRCAEAATAHYSEQYEKAKGRPVVEHGHGGYVRGCRCDECRAGHADAARHHIRVVVEPTRNRYEWTGPELELASRPDLSARQVAEMLGRTPSAVGNIRKRLKREPKLQRLAGVVPQA